MEKIYIDYSQNLYEVQKYLEDRKVDNIYLKELKIDKDSKKNSLFNEKKVSIQLNDEDTFVTEIPLKFFKVLLRKKMSTKTNYLCFFEAKKSENHISENERINFLKRDENQLMECLLNWDEDKIYFKEFKQLSIESRKKIIKEIVNKNENELNSIFNLCGKSNKNEELKSNLKKYEEKILNYLKDTKLPLEKDTKPPLEKDITDILDIKYLINYNEKMLKEKSEEKSEEKSDFLKEALKIAIVKKEILKEYLDTLEGITYFSRSYFKQAFYLYLKYILLLEVIVKEKKVEIETQKSNQSQKLNIRLMVSLRTNNSYLEKMEEAKIDLESIYKLKKIYEEYFEVKNKIEISEIVNVMVEKVEIIKKVYDTYIVKNLNNYIVSVKITPIFELEELKNGKLYYISAKIGSEEKEDDYIGIYNKVLSELTGGKYIFENDEANKRMKEYKKEEIEEIGEVVGIYFN